MRNPVLCSFVALLLFNSLLGASGKFGKKDKGVEVVLLAMAGAHLGANALMGGYFLGNHGHHKKHHETIVIG